MIPTLNGESFSWEGARMSKQKELITEILAASYPHPTASQIFEEARKRMPNIALGTVYRNLGVLVDEGTIVRLSVTGQPDRFDLPDDAHWHVICDKCGFVKDIPVAGRVIDEIERQADEEITSYLLTAHCICKHCRQVDNNTD
jgi:Fe2+ or Zn2+ uptake regulation protein